MSSEDIHKYKSVVESLIENKRVVIFSKTFCPYCHEVKGLFDRMQVAYETLELDNLGPDGAIVQTILFEMTKQKTVPNVFVNKTHVGGCDNTKKAYESGYLQELLAGIKYDYDVIVIGGGSGGLASAKEAAKLGRKVAVCDFVVPSPRGTTWGLGGTCVNVGCIPKKLMHKAAIVGSDISDAHYFGWKTEGSVHHNWTEMVENIQNYIKSLNFGYRKSLRKENVDYKNAFVKFVDPHKVEVTDKNSKSQILSARHFIIATGCRPTYPPTPGAREYCITSDDLFSLPYHPGKCLVVGASYVALECAGFLHGLGIECTVMVRSIFLRGFDQQLAEMVGSHMEKIGINVIRSCVPEKIEELQKGTPGLYKVTAVKTDPENVNPPERLELEYNTVLFAIGRSACTEGINLDKIKVQVNPNNHKIIVDDKEATSVENIFAIGDVTHGRLELTPVAIKAGVLLARRLCGASSEIMDYQNVPTTVFTPLEYGFVGLSEEDAIKQYGEQNIEVYHSNYNPLEYALSKRDDNVCYCKIICLKNEEDRVVGLHILGPNAGEVVQGFALGIKTGAKKKDFDDLVGIHPTVAEVFTSLNVSKSSGLSIMKTDC